MRTLSSLFLALVLTLPAAAAAGSWTTGAYAYDGVGNIIRIGANQYVYDQAGRVTSGTANGTVYKQTYAYDSFGNRITVSNCVGPECVQRLVATGAGTNHLQDGTAYGEAGNVESDSTGGYAHTYEFDAVESMAVQTDGSTTHEYIYTADDQRIAVHTGTAWRWSVRDLGHRVARDFTSKDQGGWTVAEDYVHTDSGLSGTLSIFGRRYTHNDHLGTPRLVTADDGRQIGAHEHYAFGEELPVGSEAPAERLELTGHERDRLPNGAAGLDYMRARYYSASLGRFQSVDPVLGEPNAPQTWNRYAYVHDNPIRFTDPTGKSVWEELFLVVRYIGRDEKIAARVHELTKNKAMKRIKQAINGIREEEAGAKIAVVAQSEGGRNAVARQLSGNKKFRGPERSGIWSVHVNPETGPHADVHVQTLADTKSAGIGKSIAGGVLAIIGANTMAANANPDATPGEVIGATAWDVAKAIDPLFLTDAIEHFSGIGQYADQPQQNQQ